MITLPTGDLITLVLFVALAVVLLLGMAWADGWLSRGR